MGYIGYIVLVLLNLICQLSGAGGDWSKGDEFPKPLPPEVKDEDDTTLPINSVDLGIVLKNGKPILSNKEQFDKVKSRFEKLKGKLTHKNDKEVELIEMEKEAEVLKNAIKRQKGRNKSEKFRVSEKLKKYLINIGSPLVKYLDEGNANGKEVGYKGKRTKRTVYINEAQMWTKGIIPFLFKETLHNQIANHIMWDPEIGDILSCFSAAWKSAAIQYMKEWEAVTAYRFVPYTPTVHAEYGLGHNTTLQFVYSDGCWSYVGRTTNNIQTISPCSGSVAAHELGHTLGLAHEQSNANQDLHVRINWDNIKPSYRSQFNVESGSNWFSFNYDYSSLMHYGLWDFNINDQKVMTILDNRLEYLVLSRYETDYFYPAYEVQLVLKLNETFCRNFTMNCYNAGYLSYVNGKCQCRCPFTLNPEDKCQTLESNVQNLSWPEGSFAFLKPIQGCPNGFMSGSVKRYEDPAGYMSGVTSDFHAAGEYTSYAYIKEEFCVKNETFTGSQSNPTKWGPGSYCILRKGGRCPPGSCILNTSHQHAFEAGAIQFDDFETSGNTTISGELPDGNYVIGTKFEFCCRNDGASTIPMELPRSIPFTLYVGSSGSCQAVKGMRVLEERYQFYNTNNSTITSRTGSYPYTYVYSGAFSRLWNIYFCFYYPMDYACGGIYNVSIGNPIIVTSPNHPQNYGNSKRCTWLLKSPEGTKLRLNFNKLDIKTTSDGSCEDLLEIRHSLPGHRGFRICGNAYRETLITETNYLILTLTTDLNNVATGFNATVDVITDLMLNYVNQGAEGTYSGKVNVSRNFDVCLPWMDVIGKCPHSMMDTSDVPDDLKENYCRNPGTGSRPWCYTNVDQCIRDYCDVSYLERCIDEWVDCAELLSLESNFCTKYANGDAWKCAKTCGKCNTRNPVIPASSVTCGPPSALSDGDYTPKKSSYAVGETVRYTCRGGTDETRRTCSSEATWIPEMSFVCGAPREKGDGWTIFQGYFYKFFDIDKTYEEAKTYCSSLNASISTAKTKEENDYIGSLTPLGEYIWLGMTDAEVEGVWKWNDGTLVTWSNWDSGQPDNWNNQDYAYMIYWNHKWSDLANTNARTFVCKRSFDARKVCADQGSSCKTLIEKVPDMRFKYSSFAWERCPRTTGLCTDADVTGQMPCSSNAPSASCAVCFDPGAVAQATKVKGGAKITVGEVFEYACNVGYTLTKGNLNRACLPSGSLTGTTPVCQDINLVPTKVSNVSTRKRENVMPQMTLYTGDNAFHRITKAGEMYEWEFYSHVNGTIALQVWRRNGLSFKLVGQNIIYKARDDRLRRIAIPSGSRIAVQPNDLIGFLYVGASSGGVTYDDCESDQEPEGMKLFYSSSTYSDPSLLSVNQTISFQASTSCKVFSLNAIVGPKL